MKQQHVLIIGIVWPEPKSTAAGWRMLQLISMFKAKNWKVSFVSSASKSDFSFDLEKYGVEINSIELNDASFDAFIETLQPTIVMFDRYITEEQFGWRVAQVCPNALRIIDTEDLHCLRLARQQAFKENRLFQNTDLISDFSKREIASILRSDLALIISEFEINLLQNYFKVDKSLLHYLPFLVEPISVSKQNSWLSFDEREHFISIGNFLHEPNWNAVLYLKESIWPLIRKQLPKAELHIYGAYPSQKAFNLNNEKEGFIIKGRAEDSISVMGKVRICIAPLRFGAGLKGKLIEAMQCGTPSVVTSIGAEAMHANLPWSGLISDSAEEIAKSAIELYTNKEKWGVSQLNGIKIIDECFLASKFESKLIEQINYVQTNLKLHRENNFIGAMLLHHSLLSTKYMSKWIEEKNKISKSNN